MDPTPTVFTPWAGLAGGALIGLSAGLMLWLAGRVTGISGVAAGLMTRDRSELAWRGMFVAGMLAGALLFRLASGEPLPVHLQVGLPAMAAGGFLVGFGTRMGSGCTAGHGICGLARLSLRSLVATVTFFATAVATVHVVRGLAS